MKLRKTILLMCIWMFACRIAYGQNFDSDLNVRVNKFTYELQKSGIDTICIYQDYCVGCEITWKNKESKCDYSGFYIPTYIFWKKNGITYATRKDNCFDYESGSINGGMLWDFCLKNIIEINSEVIRPAQSEEMVNGKKIIKEHEIDHSEHQNITIIINVNKIEKHLDEFNFSQTIYTLGAKKNINYEDNMSTKSKKLQLLLNDLVKEAYRKHLFQKKI